MDLRLLLRVWRRDGSTNEAVGRKAKRPPRRAVAGRQNRTATLLQMVTHTLDKMAAGGIYDQLGGGFHRYSVDERWLVPHFEKMLYDNALLIGCYVEALRRRRMTIMPESPARRSTTCCAK